MNDRGLHDLTEDTTGFGRAEFRTLKDSVLRPRAVLEAYMTEGPTGGGRYARPLKLYLVLCGLMMLVLFLMGGTGFMMAPFPPDTFSGMAARAGKSVDTFLADVDGWVSLALVPIMSLPYALATAPFLRWWDKEDLGWRRSFRATFAYMNALTTPMLPFTVLCFLPSTAMLGSVLMVLFSLLAFMRMGSGRWYSSPFVGIIKLLVLSLAIMAASLAGLFVLTLIGLTGAIFAP